MRGLVRFAWLSVLCLSLRTAAAVELPDPIVYLQGRDAQAQTIVKQAPTGPLPPALRQQLDNHINEVFDFSELSRLSLGSEWDKRSAAERQRFVEVFAAIIREKNYTSFLRYYREGKITYKEKKVEGERATVQAVVPLKQEQVAIGYLLRATQGQWRVYDLVIDGASTADGYQRQYSRYLQKHTYEQLIQQLGKQLDSLRQAKN
ncbi:MAG: ABC transporter substrate-binding protein [Candidatus Latescibacteria bacterium]|nr:ABC transporter substrate-binding protein [Candidatus Latescibacterota bacterium]